MWDQILGLVNAAGTAYGANASGQAAADAAKAAAAKAKADAAAAQANSAWTKYIPLGIGALVLLGVIGFFIRRK
jgi:hypothetical protein